MWLPKFAVALNEMAAGDCSAGGYTLLIKPSMGVTATLTGSLASSPLIRVNSSNVTIDGAATAGGTTRDLTITNTNATGPTVVAFQSIGTTPIINNALKNSIIINGNNGGSAVLLTANVGSNAGYFRNTTIANNDIRQAFIGIFANAVPQAANGSNVVITQNNLNATGAAAIRRVGVYVQGTDGATITQNIIGNFETGTAEVDAGIWLATAATNTLVEGNTISTLAYTGTGNQGPSGVYISPGPITGTNTISKNTISGLTSSGTSANNTRAAGITVFANTNNVNIFKNNITNVKNTNTGGYGCSGIDLASTNVAANINVANNFVSDVAAYGFDGLGADDNGYGISIAAGGGYNIYHNSVHMNTGQTTVASRPSCLNVSAGVTTAGAVNLRNNVFSNSATGANTERYAITSEAANTVFSTINFNNYYSSGTNLARTGTTNRAALADVVTGFGGNANSVAVQPVFTSATNLHLVNTANCALDNKGTVIATVTDDIDDQARATAAPDMGADEFTANASTAIYNTPATTVTDIVQVTAAPVTFKHTTCESFATVAPQGVTSPIAGAVTGRVYKYATPQTYIGKSFVDRVIDITPATNASSAAATVTLYYTQAEFDSYNMVRGAQPALPTDGMDATGIGNVRVTKFAGTPLTTPSQPGQYSGGTISLIDPVDANIVFSTVNNRWEVTFNTVGFSGFYLHTGNYGALAISVNYLTGNKVGTTNNLNWQVNCTSSTTATMVVERSSNNKIFTAINSQTATAARCAAPFNFVDATPSIGVNYYRLRVTDDNGRITYSNVVALQNGKDGFSLVSVTPNPAKTIATLSVASAKAATIQIVVTDVVGKQVLTQNATLSAGSNALPVNVANLAPGTYQVTTIGTDGVKTTLRFVKQ
jgi:hypothetical protein